MALFCAVNSKNQPIIGLLREGKNPPDKRVPLSPAACAQLMQLWPDTRIVVQPSPIRCFPEAEYSEVGCEINEDLSACNLLMGVKEVQIADLIPGKVHLFFSHVAKRQPYNKALLQAVLQKGITLLDYELLTDQKGLRTVAFGRFAGIVGAHHGLAAFGKRSGAFELPGAWQVNRLSDLLSLYARIDWPPMRILVTGDGRVGKGAVELFRAAGIQELSSSEFLAGQVTGDVAAFCVLRSRDVFRRADSNNDSGWDRLHFHAHPNLYVSRLAPYLSQADVLVNTLFWSAGGPRLFEQSDMRSASFRVRTIADISCDIHGGVPATFRFSSIADPVYGYDPLNETEILPYTNKSIDIMAVENLPCELPVDASELFGEQLLASFFPAWMRDGLEAQELIRATIARNGTLTSGFEYLGPGYGFEGS
jgi:saccharopine dehydrogenase (NAD+, L-lysine-forming)